MSIITPYFRTLIDRSGLQCGEEPDFNYNSYDLFCLRTKVEPYLKELLNSKVYIIFKSILIGNKMVMTVIPMEGTEIITLSSDLIKKIRDYINSITGNKNQSCLVYDITNTVIAYDGTKIPNYWIKSVLPYVDISSSFNPFINEIGIYVDLSKDVDYIITYNEIQMNIIEQLKQMYENGYVTNAKSIASLWNLVTLDDKEIIYLPQWKDNRFAKNLAEFLLSRLRGDKFIHIFIGDNKVKRHYIALSLSNNRFNFKFNEAYVEVEVNDLDNARLASALIFNAVHNAVGKVALISFNRPSLISLYQWASKQLDSRLNCISYSVLDSSCSFIYSCLIPYEIDGTTIINQIKKLVDQQLLSINKKGKTLEDISDFNYLND